MGIVQWLIGHVGGLLGGLLGGSLSGILDGITDHIIVLGLTLFALALGFFAISYLNHRRKMMNNQRMAALIKGLHYAGVSPHVWAKPKHDSREHFMKGVRWLFGSAGLSGALYGYERLEPVADPSDAVRAALLGIIPGALALAHFLCSWFCARQQQSDASTPQRPLYRVARRRF